MSDELLKWTPPFTATGTGDVIDANGDGACVAISPVATSFGVRMAMPRLRKLRAEWIARAMNAMAERETSCVWSYDDIDNKWDGECGAAWTFEYDGPRENKMAFCPSCGRSVVIREAKKQPLSEPTTVHLCDWAGQPDIRIACTGLMTVPAWGSTGSAKTETPNVYRAESGDLYAFSRSLVSCPKCREE